MDFKPTGFTTVTKQQRTTTLFRPGSNFTKMCMYLHSCVQSDSNSQKHL